MAYIMELLFTLAFYAKPAITLQWPIQGVQKVHMRSPFKDAKQIIFSHFCVSVFLIVLRMLQLLLKGGQEPLQTPYNQNFT